MVRDANTHTLLTSKKQENILVNILFTYFVEGKWKGRRIPNELMIYRFSAKQPGFMFVLVPGVCICFFFHFLSTVVRLKQPDSYHKRKFHVYVIYTWCSFPSILDHIYVARWMLVVLSKWKIWNLPSLLDREK